MSVAPDTPGAPPMLPEKFVGDIAGALSDSVTKRGPARLGKLDAQGVATRMLDRRSETRAARVGTRTYVVSVGSSRRCCG